MFSALINSFRLLRAGAVLLWHGADVIPADVNAPPAIKLLRSATTPLRRKGGQSVRLSSALASLGPSYIKLGQFLATRPDVIGRPLAANLSDLQDRLPPFATSTAREIIAAELGAPVDALYASFGEPVAAASIAQVHKATVTRPAGEPKAVAVKILRPDVDRRFARDLGSFFFAARTLERVSPASRRLRPVAAVQTLAESTALEMDLRMEAAAISEMAENIARAGDEGFRVPAVDWTRTSRRVLTLEWIDGVTLSNLAAIDAAGHDRHALGMCVIRSFLKHAMRDGFFHADLHQGNLFVTADGTLVAVDFGIMGRLLPKERRFLAEILYGFITRNYRRIAEVHFEAGYVPSNQPVNTFAQALRSIGEPLVDRPSDEISMARVLTQLFEVTELFGMQTRPELLLLQKTMVVTEGVARTLDPSINIWVAAEPVVRDWMTTQLGAQTRIREAADSAAALANVVADAPSILARTARMTDAITGAAEEFQRRSSDAASSGAGWLGFAGMVAAISLAAIAVNLWLG